jgi:hypothetical protein
MRESSIQLTPQGVAQIQRWLLLLAADDTAPAWDPVDRHSAPEALRAAARWLVDNGHSSGMGKDLVGVLLAMFGMTLRSDTIEGRVPQDAA